MIYKYFIDADKSENLIREKQQREKNHFLYPEGSTDISYTPAILQVCTQIRQECHQMFLSANDFVALVKEETESHDPLTDDGYGYLLRILDALGPGHVRTIKSIAIVCQDDLAGGDRNYGLIDMWYAFIPALLARGISVDQLRWPGLCLPDGYRPEFMPYSRVDDFPIVARSAERLAMTYKAVIEPTLWNHNCQSEQNPVPDVLEQVRDGRLLNDYAGHDLFAMRVERVAEGFNRAWFQGESDAEIQQHWREESMYFKGWPPGEWHPLWEESYP